MLSASQCETWLTLDELAKLTHCPQASISAQLRHLRKPRFGGFELEKRPRASGRLLRGEDYGPVWEYRLQRQHATRQDAQQAVSELENRTVERIQAGHIDPRTKKVRDMTSYAIQMQKAEVEERRKLLPVRNWRRMWWKP